MQEDGRELVVRIHRQELERYHAQKEKERALVEAMFREALERQRKQEEEELAVIKADHGAALEQSEAALLPPVEPPSLHYSELPEAEADSPIHREWELYRREVGRLLAEGHEGQFILIKGEDVVGIWNTRAEAKKAALERFLLQPCLIQQIRSREPLLRGPRRFWQCRD